MCVQFNARSDQHMNVADKNKSPKEQVSDARVGYHVCAEELYLKNMVLVRSFLWGRKKLMMVSTNRGVQSKERIVISSLKEACQVITQHKKAKFTLMC